MDDVTDLGKTVPPAEDSGAPGAAERPSKVRIRSSGWMFAAQIGQTILTIPIGVVLARTLGPSGKGAVSVAQTIAAFSVILLGFGLPSAVTWLSAKGRASARGALVMAGATALVAVAVVAAIVLALGPSATAHRLGLTVPAVLGLAVLAIVPSMVAAFCASYLLGRGRIRLVSMTNVIGLGAELVVLAVLALTGTLTVLSAVAVWILMVSGQSIAWGGAALRAGAGTPARAANLVREGRAYALKSWLGNTVNLLSLRQDVLLLAVLANTHEVGIYTVGVAAAELAWYIPTALQSVATVKFASEDDTVELAQRLNRSVWPYTVLFSGLIVMVAAPLIPLVYGAPFHASILPLVLLLPGILATSMSSALSAWLSGSGHPGDPAGANVVNMVVNLVANVLLAPRLGASGAAIASSISYSVASVLIMWRFKVRSKARLADALLPRWTDLRALAGIMANVVLDRLRRRGRPDA